MNRILVYGMTDNPGGIESYLMNYFRGLKKYDIIFDFITEYDRIAYKEEIEQLGGKIYRIPSRRDGLIKHMNAIRSVLKKHKEYQVFYCNILSASEVFTVLSGMGIKRVKTVVHSHNDSVKTITRHKILRPLLNCISNKKLACSKRAAVFMFGERNVSKHKVQIVNNAINLEKYKYSPEVRKQMRQEFGITEDTFIVGHVGRMCYQKNTLFLIDVFNEINKKDKNTKLLLIGDGEDRNKVEDAIREYGLEKHIMLLGVRDDVEKMMQMMDVFVLPSRFEGLGIVLIEAQAAGLQCIGSDQFGNEANISGKIQYYPLDMPIDEWADCILKCKNIDRNTDTTALKNGGYDICENIIQLKKILVND